MERKPCSNGNSANKGAWSAEENEALKQQVDAHGPRRWREISRKAGLNRSPKSCRLRWLNYLRPGIKRGNISDDEEDLILRLHKLLGNRWSLISGRLPGRTDSEIKNHWNCNMKKKLLMGNYDRSRGEPRNYNFKEVDDISGIEDEEKAVPSKIITNGYETEKIPSFSSLVVSDQLPEPKDSSATFLVDLEMYLNDHDLQNTTDIDHDLQKWINQLCEDDGNLQQEESGTALSFLADGTQELEDWESIITTMTTE